MAIHVAGLSKRFGTQTVFQNLDLEVRTGEVLGIAGGSGTGKSVLLRCLTGLEPIAAGQITLFPDAELQPGGAPHGDKSGRRWGMLFQDGALFGGLTVAQNVAVPMLEHLDIAPATAAALAAMKIALVGLPPEAGGKYPAQLSGGMRKRAGLARALALDPELLFLDEPTAGLDPIGAASFDTLVRQLQGTLGLTVVMVTHDLDSLFAICDRVAVLAEQHVVRIGHPGDVAANPGHPWVSAYFGGARGFRARSAA
jgi:phospholipid/cholesterol/gamma-HCH transport system ATP-binding protein